MKTYEIIERIQNNEKEKIVLIQVGIFYIAIGLDAYILHELLGLKLNGYSSGKFKVGIPVSTIQKYIEILKEKNIDFCVYESIKEEDNNLNEKDWVHKHGYKKIYENSSNERCFESAIKECDSISNIKKDENFLEVLMQIKLLKSYVECSIDNVNKLYFGDLYE